MARCGHGQSWAHSTHQPIATGSGWGRWRAARRRPAATSSGVAAYGSGVWLPTDEFPLLVADFGGDVFSEDFKDVDLSTVDGWGSGVGVGGFVIGWSPVIVGVRVVGVFGAVVFVSEGR